MIVIGADAHKRSYTFGRWSPRPVSCVAARRCRRPAPGMSGCWRGRAAWTRRGCGRSRTAATSPASSSGAVGARRASGKGSAEADGRPAARRARARQERPDRRAGGRARGAGGGDPDVADGARWRARRARSACCWITARISSPSAPACRTGCAGCCTTAGPNSSSPSGCLTARAAGSPGPPARARITGRRRARHAPPATSHARARRARAPRLSENSRRSSPPNNPACWPCPASGR